MDKLKFKVLQWTSTLTPINFCKGGWQVVAYNKDRDTRVRVFNHGKTPSACFKLFCPRSDQPFTPYTNQGIASFESAKKLAARLTRAASNDQEKLDEIIYSFDPTPSLRDIEEAEERNSSSKTNQERRSFRDSEAREARIQRIKKLRKREIKEPLIVPIRLEVNMWKGGNDIDGKFSRAGWQVSSFNKDTGTFKRIFMQEDKLGACYKFFCPRANNIFKPSDKDLQASKDKAEALRIAIWKKGVKDNSPASLKKIDRIIKRIEKEAEERKHYLLNRGLGLGKVKRCPWIKTAVEQKAWDDKIELFLKGDDWGEEEEE